MRLLIVEDEPELSALIVKGLREEGHAVDAAASLAGADELCSYTDYALVVLDLSLPDGDGTRLCRALRDSGRARVLVLTARDRLDELTVQVEARPELPPGLRDDAAAALAALVQDNAGVRVQVSVGDPGSVERSAGKMRRVLDHRSPS